MILSRELWVDPEEAEYLEKICREPVPGKFARDEAVFDKEVKFQNGYRMAIQVIASEDSDIEPCWTQGVLFDPNGKEAGCTEVGDLFDGEYTVTIPGYEFTVVIVKRKRGFGENVLANTEGGNT